MTSSSEILRPAIETLVELGKGIGGARVSSNDRSEIKDNLERAYEVSVENSAKEKSQAKKKGSR